MALTADQKEDREDRKALRELSSAVTFALNAIDAEMKLPPSPERGGRIAKIMNALDMANDKVRYFRLGVDFRTDIK